MSRALGHRSYLSVEFTACQSGILYFVVPDDIKQRLVTYLPKRNVGHPLKIAALDPDSTTGKLVTFSIKPTALPVKFFDKDVKT